jgi:hypothetical protein
MARGEGVVLVATLFEGPDGPLLDLRVRVYSEFVSAPDLILCDARGVRLTSA